MAQFTDRLNLENFNIVLLDMLIKLNKGKRLFLAGDFNLDLLKSDTHSATGKVLDTFMSHQMLPVIRKPTRNTDIIVPH